MSTTKNNLKLILLPFALCGFAIAQPIYNLLLQTPVFLVVRQTTPLDVWILVIALSLALPLVVVLPAWLTQRRWPSLSSTWGWMVSSVFAALFFAQLLLESLGGQTLLFMVLAAGLGAGAAWVLLFTRWSLLVKVMAGIAAIFPLWFMLLSPVLEQVEDFAVVPPDRDDTDRPLPDIIFVVLDELPLATLLDNRGQVDEALFPGFARLQSISNWYYDTISVSDGTDVALPAILTSQYPGEKITEVTFAAQPINLFTVLRQHYDFNVSESITRLCPQALCPQTGPGDYNRIKALLLDLSAIYLHRVVPDRWGAFLPDVTNNWSGFFAEPQVFFPQPWLEHAGAQTEIDRPGHFRNFITSIRRGEGPTLNFMHILFPHGPYAYLPNGENYGLAWMWGLTEERWANVEWASVSGMQRHYLQVQHADQLVNELLDHLQEQQMLNSSMIIVTADHGISFAPNDTRRALSDINKPAMLRVPLFIKYPGQVRGRRIEQPVMTIDILPTLLAALGFSDHSLEMDGIDLSSGKLDIPRRRWANSYLDRTLSRLDEAELDIGNLVAGNRTRLRLDDPDHALWQIGPFDNFQGQPMADVCNQTTADIKVYYGKFRPLPNTGTQTPVRAYIEGSFTGHAAIGESKPFLITDDDKIIASGSTWIQDKYPRFFALVEPGYVKGEEWKPKAWLLDGQQCLGSPD